ncbi:hypothetical protein CRG98_050360, partial [Punica granatum]
MTYSVSAKGCEQLGLSHDVARVIREMLSQYIGEYTAEGKDQAPYLYGLAMATASKWRCPLEVVIGTDYYPGFLALYQLLRLHNRTKEKRFHLGMDKDWTVFVDTLIVMVQFMLVDFFFLKMNISSTFPLN